MPITLYGILNCDHVVTPVCKKADVPFRLTLGG